MCVFVVVVVVFFFCLFFFSIFTDIPICNNGQVEVQIETRGSKD